MKRRSFLKRTAALLGGSAIVSVPTRTQKPAQPEPVDGYDSVLLWMSLLDYSGSELVEKRQPAKFEKTDGAHRLFGSRYELSSPVTFPNVPCGFSVHFFGLFLHHTPANGEWSCRGGIDRCATHVITNGCDIIVQEASVQT